MTLSLPRKANKRTTYAARTGMNSRAAQIAARAVVERPEFIEDDDGHRMRVWKASEMQSYSNDDIKLALRGNRAVEREDMLEFVPPSAVKYCVTKGWLVEQPAGIFLVTRKAAAELDLPRKVGGRKVLFHDAGL